MISGEYKVRADGDKFEKCKGLYDQARISSPKLKQETDAAFGRYLSNMEKVGAEPKRVRRQRGWQLPTLKECRAKWLTRFPDTQWHEPDVNDWEGERSGYDHE